MLTFRDDGMELFAAVQAAYGGSLFLHPFGEAWGFGRPVASSLLGANPDDVQQIYLLEYQSAPPSIISTQPQASAVHATDA